MTTEQTEVIKACDSLLIGGSQSSAVPTSEKEFKRLFDEFSEGISYKQQFLDKNAFVVYYTQGFDGPGRPSIDTEDEGTKR